MMNQLAELARNKNKKSRGELLLALADLFLAAEKSEACNTGELFTEIMGRILDHVDVAERCALSEKMAAHDVTPRELALLLAEDLIEVAEPILRQSEVLTVADLVRVASTKEIEHQLAIAQRDDVDVAVTDILVQRGSIEVAHKVTENEDAGFSKEALGLLVARARKDEVLQVNLASRDDLPKEVARNLMPFLPKDLRDRLDKIVNGAGVEKQEKMVGGIRCIEEDRGSTVAVIDEIKQGHENVDEVVERLAAQENISEICFLLAELTNVDEKKVEKSILLAEAMPIMMICRASGLSARGFTAVAQLRSFHLDQSMAAAQSTIRQFRTIPREKAEKTVRSIK